MSDRALADNVHVSIWLIGGMIVGTWALLSIVGGEHMRGTEELKATMKKREAADAANAHQP